jgi:ribosomal protein S18 acetylase RimI-like enzyme
VSALLPSLHTLAHSHGVRRLYYAGDSAADTWMQPALRAIGYVRDTEVIVYEKRGLYVPSRGNSVVRIRRAVVVDLPQILEVDAACFTPQWMKDETIISPALVEMPYFVVAELGGAIVGYAFATKHFGGRLVHLVRIAVHPQYQGQRVGIRLLADVVDFARISGADTLALNTQVDNLNAQQLYEWFGFRRTGEWQTVLRKDI